MTKQPKTLILGFDALDWRYLERFRSTLPNLTALCERGVTARLESTHPPWTGSAWPSMYTGCDPSHHGVFGFFTYESYPDEGAVVSRADVESPAIWDYLADRDVPSVVLNVPVTHPADAIEGALIPGYLASEDEPGHPAGIRETLSDRLGEPYRIYSTHETASNREKKLAGYRSLIDLRRRAACSLLETEPWAFALIQVQKTDAVFHNFERERDFRTVYEAADRVVGDVLETVAASDDDVNVIVCSDHGIGPVTGYSLYVNELLRQHGYIETADGETPERRSLSTVKGSLTETESSDEDDSAHRQPQTAPTTRLEQLLTTTTAGTGQLLERAGIDPTRVYDVAERVGLEGTLLRLTPDSVIQSMGERVDWRRSKAFCPEGTRMGIRINLEGRDPAGVVSPAEYETVREDIISILTDFETPDGEPAFELVCRREERYDGPFLERAPDILFRPTEMNHNVKAELYGRTAVSVAVHDHKCDGVFIGAGPGFDETATAEHLSLTDVAPITLSLLGQPVPDAMTGTVPDGLLTRPVKRAAYGSVPYATATVTAGDNEAVTNRLEDLGYL